MSEPLDIQMSMPDARELREVLLGRPGNEHWSTRVLNAVEHALANGIDEDAPDA